MSSLKEILRWYNGDVVPTLEAMQNMIAFYHNKNFVMLKLSCILPILTYNCLYRSTDASLMDMKQCCKISERTWLADHRLYSRVKQSLEKF